MDKTLVQASGCTEGQLLKALELWLEFWVPLDLPAELDCKDVNDATHNEKSPHYKDLHDNLAKINLCSYVMDPSTNLLAYKPVGDVIIKASKEVKLEDKKLAGDWSTLVKFFKQNMSSNEQIWGLLDERLRSDRTEEDLTGATSPPADKKRKVN